MDAELVKLLIDSSALTIALVLILYWNRRDAREREARVEERLREEREDKLLMIATLQHNTEVLSELIVIVRDLNGKK